jgi:hypothetical protein
MRLRIRGHAKLDSLRVQREVGRVYEFVDARSSTLDAFRVSLDASTNSWTGKASLWTRPESRWAGKFLSRRIQHDVGRVCEIVDVPSLTLGASSVSLGAGTDSWTRTTSFLVRSEKLWTRPK